MTNRMLEAALYYREELNWSVIPLSPGSKFPPKGFEVIPYRNQMASIDQIKAWWRENSSYNVGIVTGKLSNLLVIDHDRYKKEYNEDAVLEYIPDNINTPVAKSPKGGQHQYFAFPANIKELTIGTKILPGMDYRGDNGYIVAPPSVNEDGTYEWLVTPGDVPLASAPRTIVDLILKNKYIYTGMSQTTLQAVTSVTNCDIWSNGSRDENLFHVALSLAKTGNSESYIAQTLAAIMKSWGEYDERWIYAKIQSAMDRKSRKERNLAYEVEAFLSVTSGDISVTNCYNELQVVTKEDKTAVRQAFSRLHKMGVIEKVGQKDGVYRYIDKSDDEIIDIFDADLTPYDITLPLKIHEFVTIHKSNIIIIAGESNSGKTSFCLNVARMNRNKHKINYLSSEMQDGTELRIRLNEFGEPIEKWRPVKFQFRTDNFPDKIKPDELNIIDYLDEGADGEAYKMAARIKDISVKLKSGIAVIAIQKDPNKDFGYGGSGTLNRSRLYLTTTKKGIMTIKKGKIWRNKTWNPDNTFCEYKLVGGCKYSIANDHLGLGGWQR